MGVECGITAGGRRKSARMFGVHINAPRRCVTTAVAADLIGQTDMHKGNHHSAETAMPGETKTCRTCGVVKPMSDFRPEVRKGRTYYRGNCRKCDNAKYSKWYRERPAPSQDMLPIDSIQEKRCTKCRLLLPLSNFGPNKASRLGVRSKCRKCESEASMSWLDVNYEKAWDTRLRRNFGITLERFRQLLAEQNDVCAICGEPPETVAYRTSRRQGRPLRPILVVDHDHETGKVRGLLCSTCNSGIGLLKDSPDILRSAIKYLEERGGE